MCRLAVVESNYTGCQCARKGPDAGSRQISEITHGRIIVKVVPLVREMLADGHRGR
jgi:hypothetical protein